MALIAELDQSLEALRALKPPGVSKSKVASITNLFVENIQVLQPSLLSFSLGPLSCLLDTSLELTFDPE